LGGGGADLSKKGREEIEPTRYTTSRSSLPLCYNEGGKAFSSTSEKRKGHYWAVWEREVGPLPRRQREKKKAF